MVKSILFNISKNQREAEIERNKDRKDLSPNSDLVFREYYTLNNDKMIVRIMYSFFSAVKESFIYNNGISYWSLDSTPETNVLQTNVGYQALMKILTDLLKIAPEDTKDKKSYYISHLVKAKYLDFVDDSEEKRYPFTSKSVKVLYNDLKEKIGISAFQN